MLQRCAGVLAVVALAATAACAGTDAGITTNVKTKLAADDAVSAYQVDVDTRNAVVTLTGDVETSAARDRALALARETDGVRDVIDQIRVNDTAATAGTLPGEPDAGGLVEEGRDAAAGVGAAVTDAAITSAVKAKFLTDTAVKGLEIDVDTNAGMVTLNGIVTSRAEADRAVMLARGTEGVKGVNDNLQVGR